MGGGEGDVLVVVLSGLQAVVGAVEESVEQVALGGGVAVAGGFACRSGLGRRVRISKSSVSGFTPASSTSSTEQRYALDMCSTATAMWCTAKSWSGGSST